MGSAVSVARCSDDDAPGSCGPARSTREREPGRTPSQQLGRPGRGAMITTVMQSGYANIARLCLRCSVSGRARAGPPPPLTRPHTQAAISRT